jgi:site-specific DNA recombinase
MEQQPYKVGAYCRLSRDDENIGESGSITMQKEIIRQYCESKGLKIASVYQDDGYSGLNYNRPDFKRMLDDIAAGNIDCVITKDLSRLGRDYIMTGYYTEIFFPENKVRYIAIGDAYDSQEKNNGSNDYAPFKFILNDMYAKDLSKKQRASRLAKSLNREYVTAYAPYGYKKDPDHKNHLIIDAETAPVVTMIFDMYAKGMGRGKIRDYLNENKVLTPLALLHTRGQRYDERMEIEENRYQWSRYAINVMLDSQVYIGNAVHLKFRKATHKSKMRKQPKSDQLVIEGTHEPLISIETWDKVHEFFRTHADRTYVHENIFMGLVKCIDCGKSLNYGRTPRQPKVGKRGRDMKITRYLTCATYGRYGNSRCTSHYVSYDMLSELVQERLNRIIKMVNVNADRVRAKILRERNRTSILADESAAKKLSRNEKRLHEISRIYTKLYEDRALDVISEENFRTLNDKLQNEQEQLHVETESIKQKMAETIEADEDTDSFISLVKGMKHIDVLDEKVLNALIDRIDVGEKVTDENQEVYQQVDISYKFVGKLDF